MQHDGSSQPSQWLGAEQLQAIELIGFPKQIIFSFILPCPLIVQPPPLTASYKWLSTGREKWDWKKKTGKNETSSEGHEHLLAWDYNHLLKLPANLIVRPLFNQNTTDLVMTQQETYTKSIRRMHTNNLTPSWNRERIRGFEFVCMWVCVLAHIHTQNWEMQLEWQSNQVG